MTHETAVKLEAEEVNPRNALSIAAALGKDWDAGDALVYAVRRVLALAKDKARKEAGRPAEHVYTPDLSHVEDPKLLAQRAEALRSVAATYKAAKEPTRIVKAPRTATAARSVKP